MKALVTGATGFIGGAIARHLLGRGDEVHVLARDPGRARTLEGARVHAGSILDPNAILAAARGVDVVFHAAGIASPRASARALRWAFVAGTENVLSAARAASCERVVMISCADVTLSNQDRVHWDEKRDLSAPPVGERARALKLAEEIALSVSDDALPVCALRGTWVWGPGDTTTLPGLIAEARSGGVRMVGPGKTLVATTHVDHLVEAALAAARSPRIAGQAYYVADGEFLELREFLGAMLDTLRLPPPRHGSALALAYPLAQLRRGDDPLACPEEVLRRGRSTLFDINKAIADLDFRPHITIDAGMKALARWVEAQGGLDAVAALKRPLPDERVLEREIHDAQRAAAG